MSDNSKSGDWTFWFIACPFGIVLGILFFGLRLFGILKVQGLSRLQIKSRQQGLLLVCNHPSLWEPLLLYGLIFPHYLWHPIRNSPWSTPDRVNYWEKWPWKLFRSCFIPVPRGSGQEGKQALDEVARVLARGDIVILFPEGGRTGKGHKDQFVVSPSGKRLRAFKSGLGRLICESGFDICPVWIDGTDRVLPIGCVVPRLWRRVMIKVGNPIKVEGDSRQRARRCQDALLNLADEGD